MAKKNMRDAAAAGTSVFDTIAAGDIQDVQDVQNVLDVQNVQNGENTLPAGITKQFQTALETALQNVLDVQNVQDVKDVYGVQNTARKKVGRPPKSPEPQVRLNLKIPVELRDYLQDAAFRNSTPKTKVSLTEYLCGLIRADMEKHGTNEET